MSDNAPHEETPTCPKCGELLSVELVAKAKAQSHISFCISPKEGELISARTLGGVIESFAKLLESVAAHYDFKSTALVRSITTREDGTIQLDALIVRSAKEAKRSREKRRKAA